MSQYNTVPGVDEEYNFAPEIRQAIASSTEVTAAIGVGVADRVPTEVALAMAEDTTLEQAAVAAMQDAAVQAQLAWVKGSAAVGSTMASLPLGVTQIQNGGVAGALGLPFRVGAIEIKPVGSTIRTATYVTNYVSESSPVEVWTAATNSSGVWQPWKKIYPTPSMLIQHPVGLLGDIPLMDLPVGLHWSRSASMSLTMGLPTSTGIGRVGKLEITQLPGLAAADDRYKQFLWTTEDVDKDNPLEVWRMSVDHLGNARPWQMIYPEPVRAPEPDYAARHLILKEQLKARVRGTIDTGGATPVAFVWDDYPALMKSLVIEEARRIGIKLTFAACSRSLDPGYEHLKGEGTVTWNDINSWAATGVVEIANHSSTHGDATTDAQLQDAIVLGKSELQTLCPDASINTWVQPSVNYPGFNNGDSPDAYAATKAGKLIMAYHGYYTGVQKLIGSGAIPMTGDTPSGMSRVWVDSMTEADRKVRVTSLHGTGNGIILSTHANQINQPNRWTLGQMVSYMEWLKAEETAGRIRIMFLSEFAFARP